MAAALLLIASAYYDACGANGEDQEFWQLELHRHCHSLAPMAAALALMDSAHHDACIANGEGQDVPLEAEFWQQHCLRHWRKTSCV